MSETVGFLIHHKQYISVFVYLEIFVFAIGKQMKAHAAHICAFLSQNLRDCFLYISI